jgi:hypothetical protein
VTRGRQRVTKKLHDIRIALETEGAGTVEMVEIYGRYAQRKASRDDILRANAQFRDVLKSVGLGTVAIALLPVPGSTLLLFLVVKLGRRCGVELLPRSFRDL